MKTFIKIQYSISCNERKTSLTLPMILELSLQDVKAKVGKTYRKKMSSQFNTLKKTSLCKK